MKTLIIYYSMTGFTKRYALWLLENLGGDCLEYSEAKRRDLSEYDTIIFGSNVLAGGVGKLKWFKDLMRKYKDKNYVIFCVGASPSDSPSLDEFRQNNFSDSIFDKVKVFYCPGGFNNAKLPLPYRMMMKIFMNSLKVKKDKSDEESFMVEMLSKDYDISSKKYILPIINCVNDLS